MLRHMPEQCHSWQTWQSSCHAHDAHYSVAVASSSRLNTKEAPPNELAGPFAFLGTKSIDRFDQSSLRLCIKMQLQKAKRLSSSYYSHLNYIFTAVSLGAFPCAKQRLFNPFLTRLLLLAAFVKPSAKSVMLSLQC